MANAPTSPLPDGYTRELRLPPVRLTAAEFMAALDLLTAGEAVSVASAREEIPRAKALALVKKDGELVGIGTIKSERRWYAEDVQAAEKSGFKFDSDMLELGYVAVSAKHGGKHFSGRIVDALLSHYDGSLFATTDHARMKSTLANRGFVREGKEWEGQRGTLSLWLLMRSDPPHQ